VRNPRKGKRVQPQIYNFKFNYSLHDNVTRIEHKCITKVPNLHRPQLTAHSLLHALLILASKSPKAPKFAFSSLHTVGADPVIDPLAVKPPQNLPSLHFTQ
jgi:hypothetical protein